MLHRMGGKQVFASGPVDDQSAVPVVRDDARWLEALQDARSEIVTTARGLISVHPRWHILERCLAQHVFYFVTDGSVRGHVGSRSFVLEPGSLMWIRPSTWHELELAQAGQPFTMYNLRFQLYCDGEQIAFSDELYVRRDGWEFQRLVEILFDDLTRDHRYQNQRLKAILALIWTELAGGVERDGIGNLNSSARSRLQRYVRDHVADWPAPSDLAAQLDLSEDYFRRVFHRSFGMSPRSWLLRERIRLAAMRVADSPDLSLTAIAETFGYGDLPLFSRQFKRVMGVSPRAYRRGR
ncbi:MAG: AraC family transcriptional regulator [Planctomycetota bacterium]|nr:AraC family transcriptional regulator [Planctomycetota bacterium]